MKTFLFPAFSAIVLALAMGVVNGQDNPVPADQAPEYCETILENYRQEAESGMPKRSIAPMNRCGGDVPNGHTSIKCLVTDGRLTLTPSNCTCERASQQWRCPKWVYNDTNIPLATSDSNLDADVGVDEAAASISSVMVSAVVAGGAIVVAAMF